MATTLIKNGKVISTTGVIAQDVLITDETVTALGAPGYFTEEGLDRVIDAAGKYVIPGGIDVHTHMEMPFGGTYASDTFETGTRAGGVGWRDHDRRHGRAEHRRQRAHRARRLASQGRRQLRDRLRLPPDHRRRRRGVVEGDEVPRRSRGSHQLQTLHGLPRRALQRRRPDPASHADRRRVRGDDHDARRERHRHRRVGAASPRPRRHRPEVPQLHPAVAARGRGNTSRHRAQPRGRQRAAVHRAHVGRRRAQRGRRGTSRRSQRVRRDLPAVPVADARRDTRQARIRRCQVGLQHTDPQQGPRPRLHRPDGSRAPRRPLEGLADERARCGVAPITARSA